MNFLFNRRLFWLFPIVVWGVLATLSAEWNLKNLDGMGESLAYERAKSMFRLVQMTRLWNAQHGGVYVPESKTTPSNPYLEDPFKDVVTTGGVKLTKLNPAYMTRQIADVARESGGILFHITSLKPINPGNVPDEWEASALAAFEREVPETLEFFDNAEQPVYRYMGPLYTKKACMQCHEKQGYEVGDVRGGISVTLPAAPILDAQYSARSQVVQIHLAAFILLTATTLFFLAKLRQQWRLVNDTKEQLADSEHFLRSITDAAGEGVVTMNNQGQITFANPEARRLLGWGQDAEDADPEAFQQGLSASHDFVAATTWHHGGESAEVLRVSEAGFLHRNGHTVPVSFVSTPILDSNQIAGRVVVFQDITLRKEMEKTMVRSETMSALGGMVAGVAHEVNTPVGVSVTSASYLATKTNDLLNAFEGSGLTKSALKSYLDISRESTSIILSNLERAARMIKSFKQIAADQASEARSHFDLKEYMESVLLTLRPELKRTALEVVLNCPKDIKMESYPGALSQVITNLVMNSKVHAFDEGEPGLLQFDIERSGGRIEIVYSDNGKGIPGEHIENIFDPFFTTRRGKGSSGLGLHISHNLVHTVLKGTLDVSSVHNEGTRFTLVIPVSPE
jgi:PAS domain S-box-containing protein